MSLGKLEIWLSARLSWVRDGRESKLSGTSSISFPAISSSVRLTSFSSLESILANLHNRKSNSLRKHLLFAKTKITFFGFTIFFRILNILRKLKNVGELSVILNFINLPCEVRHKIWTRSVQQFWRLLFTNKQTSKAQTYSEDIS